MKGLKRRIVSLLIATFMMLACFVNASAVSHGNILAYETLQINENEIRVIFSENLSETDLSDTAIINTETGIGMSISSPYIINNEIIIPVNDNYEKSVEYCVVLSENLNLDDRYIYFVTDMDRTKTQRVTLINDTFDDYTDNGTKLNVPQNWYARKQGTFNEHQFYSDSEHNKAVRSGINGYVKSVFTRNFEKVIDYKFTMEFDYKQLAMNKYIQGEEDPNLIQAVFDSVKQSVASFNNIENLNKNMGLALAPVFEDGQVRKTSNGNEIGASSFLPDADASYVSGDKLVTPVKFFQLYGDRLGFGNWELPDEGNYVRINKNEWYHIKIDIDMENLEAIGYINDVQIGPYALPASYRDAQHGAVAARATFSIENPVVFPLKGGSTTYVDSETGETKTYATKHDSQYVIDNFKIISEEPEFKPIQTRLVSMDGRQFFPIKEANAVINKMTIAFTSGIDTSTVSNSTVIVRDNDGNIYTHAVTDYDQKNSTVELTFDNLLPVNKDYTVSVDGVMSDTHNYTAEGYQTFFSVGDKDGLYIGKPRAVNAFQSEIIGGATRGTVAFFDGYMVEIAGQERKLNLVVAAYKSDADGERMITQTSRGLALRSQEKNISVREDRLYITLLENVDVVKAFVYEMDGFSDKDSITKAEAKQNSIKIEGNAKPNEEVILDIPVDDEQYATNKNCPMVYRKVINADENGKYSFTLSTVGMSSEKYTAYVYTLEEKNVDEYEFIYSTENDINSNAALLNLSSDKANDLGNNYTKLGIDIDLYNENSNEQVAEILENLGDLPENDAEQVKEILNKAYLISAVDNGNIENLFDYSDLIQLSETELNEWLEKEYVTENFEKAVTDSLENKEFETVSDFYDEVTEQFVLNVVALQDGYGDAEEIIKAFQSDIVIDTDALSEDAYRKTAGTKYASYEDLVSALNVNNGSDSEEGGSTLPGENGTPPSDNVGGSPSGNGGGVGGVSISTPEEKEEKDDETLLYDIFEDIEGVIWAKPAIVYLAEQGIINGTSETTFSPNNLITREEMAKILVNVYLADVSMVDVPFEDTDKTAWYYPYISKAFASGVIKGYNNTSFGIGDYITRQDLAVMVYNASIAAGEVYNTSSEMVFDDDSKIADYAKAAVYALKGANAINGIDGLNFAPEGNATRAEAAKIIYSLLKL